MPRRWGKTVNLDMLKRFLEIQVDSKGEPISEKESDNYKLFAGGQIDAGIRGKREIFPLNIAKTKLFGVTDSLTIQGTYPVIHADFKNCKAGDYNSIKGLIRTDLSEIFSQHSYLQNSTKLKPQQRKLIRKYIEESEDVQIARGLKVLSEMLFCHYDKKVWILIDEYDAVANIAYREFDADNLDKTIKLFSGIYETALKSNCYLEKGVLTGVQYITQSGMLSGLNNLRKINFTSAKYGQHYGLEQTEVELFFEHFEVPKKLRDKAKLWYNGYKIKKYCPQNKEVHLKEIVGKYNIWSIVSYLTEGEFTEFKSYWEESGSINFIDVLFANPEVREQMEKLINGESIYLERKDDFSVSDFEILKNITGGNKKISLVGLNLLFSYLFIGGYLTIDGKKKDCYELPNMEIKYEMRNKIIDYYRDIYRIDSKNFETLIDIVRSIIDTKEYNQNNIRALFKNFYNQFKEMIKGVKLVDDHNNEGVFTNEDVVHSLLNYIVLQTQHSTFGSEIYTNKLDSGKKGRADIKLTNGDVGIIIEVKCVSVPTTDDGHMKDAIKQAISYGNLLNTRNKIFVAINVEKKAAKPEKRSIELLCASYIEKKSELEEKEAERIRREQENEDENEELFGADSSSEGSAEGEEGRTDELSDEKRAALRKSLNLPSADEAEDSAEDSEAENNSQEVAQVAAAGKTKNKANRVVTGAPGQDDPKPDAVAEAMLGSESESEAENLPAGAEDEAESSAARVENEAESEVAAIEDQAERISAAAEKEADVLDLTQPMTATQEVEPASPTAALEDEAASSDGALNIDESTNLERVIAKGRSKNV
eukprot:augustus_masked-scaffold_59-processed-gene-0.7-mRNA-1 protein AED:1.00 eAED:1.00 QI:0/0/0/0/1/1/2/0/819